MSFELVLKHLEIPLYGLKVPLVQIRTWTMQILPQSQKLMQRCSLYLSHFLLMRLKVIFTPQSSSLFLLFLAKSQNYHHYYCRVLSFHTLCALEFLHLLHQEVLSMVTNPMMMMIWALWTLTTMTATIKVNYVIYS